MDNKSAIKSLLKELKSRKEHKEQYLQNKKRKRSDSKRDEIKSRIQLLKNVIRVLETILGDNEQKESDVKHVRGNVVLTKLQSWNRKTEFESLFSDLHEHVHETHRVLTHEVSPTFVGQETKQNVNVIVHEILEYAYNTNEALQLSALFQTEIWESSMYSEGNRSLLRAVPFPMWFTMKQLNKYNYMVKSGTKASTIRQPKIYGNKQNSNPALMQDEVKGFKDCHVFNIDESRATSNNKKALVFSNVTKAIRNAVHVRSYVARFDINTTLLLLKAVLGQYNKAFGHKHANAVDYIVEKNKCYLRFGRVQDMVMCVLAPPEHAAQCMQFVLDVALCCAGRLNLSDKAARMAHDIFFAFPSKRQAVYTSKWFCEKALKYWNSDDKYEKLEKLMDEWKTMKFVNCFNTCR